MRGRKAENMALFLFLSPCFCLAGEKGNVLIEIVRVYAKAGMEDRQIAMILKSK